MHSNPYIHGSTILCDDGYEIYHTTPAIIALVSNLEKLE